MKAIESEALLTELCSDVRSLDYAKRNLTATISALKNMQILSERCIFIFCFFYWLDLFSVLNSIYFLFLCMQQKKAVKINQKWVTKYSSPHENLLRKNEISMKFHWKFPVMQMKELKSDTARRDYREASGRLQAVLHLTNSFKNYQHIPKIAQITSEVDQVTAELKDFAWKEFDGWIFSKFFSLISSSFIIEFLWQKNSES